VKKSPDTGQVLRPLFTAGLREWLLLLLGGFLLWAAVALLGRFTAAFTARDATYYPVLTCLVAPAFIVAGVRASGRRGAATLVALCFTGLVLAVARAAPPLLVIPALGVDVWYAYRGTTRRPGGAVMAGFLFAWVFYSVEAAWMFWFVGVGWPRTEILGGLVFTLLAGMVSGVIGYLLGGLLRP
jgi:hypothetical protein